MSIIYINLYQLRPATDIFLLTQSGDNLVTQSGDLIAGSAIVVFLLTQSNDNLVTQSGDLMFGMAL